MGHVLLKGIKLKRQTRNLPALVELRLQEGTQTINKNFKNYCIITVVINVIKKRHIANGPNLESILGKIFLKSGT